MSRIQLLFSAVCLFLGASCLGQSNGIVVETFDVAWAYYDNKSLRSSLSIKTMRYEGASIIAACYGKYTKNVQRAWTAEDQRRFVPLFTEERKAIYRQDDYLAIEDTPCISDCVQIGPTDHFAVFFPGLRHHGYVESQQIRRETKEMLGYFLDFYHSLCLGP